MERILLAGGTGYLGGYILSELLHQGFQTRAIVRNMSKIRSSLREHSNLEILHAELTQPSSIKNSCKDIDVVISTIGITKSKAKQTYMEVDYQANMNLLREAQRSGVRKFIYISVLKGEQLKNIAVCKAKEQFVYKLKRSGLEYCVVRPNGFFSDMSEFFKMAKNGQVYLFGHGKFKLNPIHGEDLAKVCVQQIKGDITEFDIGGPEIYTHKEIAEMAFSIIGKKPKISYIPDWVRKLLLKTGKIFMSKYTYGALEFFLHAMAMDLVAPKYGKHTLREYFMSQT